MSDSIIIGVDHGYAAMKTAYFAFPSGLVAYEHEPYTLSNVLEYGGKFYVVGSGRQPLQKDKTQAEDYYLLTLAAIAKELEYRNAGTMADVHLATGLPLTSFGRDKKPSETTCAGMESRCPSALKAWITPLPSPKCLCIRRAMPRC